MCSFHIFCLFYFWNYVIFSTRPTGDFVEMFFSAILEPSRPCDVSLRMIDPWHLWLAAQASDDKSTMSLAMDGFDVGASQGERNVRRLTGYTSLLTWRLSKLVSRCFCMLFFLSRVHNTGFLTFKRLWRPSLASPPFGEEKCLEPCCQRSRLLKPRLFTSRNFRATDLGILLFIKASKTDVFLF